MTHLRRPRAAVGRPLIWTALLRAVRPLLSSLHATRGALPAPAGPAPAPTARCPPAHPPEPTGRPRVARGDADRQADVPCPRLLAAAHDLGPGRQGPSAHEQPLRRSLSSTRPPGFEPASTSPRRRLSADPLKPAHSGTPIPGVGSVGVVAAIADQLQRPGMPTSTSARHSRCCTDRLMHRDWRGLIHLDREAL